LGHILVSGSNDHATKFWTRHRPEETLETMTSHVANTRGDHVTEWNESSDRGGMTQVERQGPSMVGMAAVRGHTGGFIDVNSNDIPGLGQVPVASVPGFVGPDGLANVDLSDLKTNDRFATRHQKRNDNRPPFYGRRKDMFRPDNMFRPGPPVFGHVHLPGPAGPRPTNSLAFGPGGRHPYSMPPPGAPPPGGPWSGPWSGVPFNGPPPPWAGPSQFPPGNFLPPPYPRPPQQYQRPGGNKFRPQPKPQ
jgi:hypothetical protein